MEFTAKQIADFIGGKVEGDENAKISTFAKIEEGTPGAISFLSNPKYTHYLYETSSSIVLVNEDVMLERKVKPTLIRVKNAYDSLAKLLQFYQASLPKKKGISLQAFISKTATIGKDCYVGAFAVIGEGAIVGDNTQIYPNTVIGDRVSIGQNSTLYPNVTIYDGCRLGNNVTIHSGCVIGADGFGFAPTPNGYDKIPQIGIVTIQDNVEIGANTCVDRSTMGSTLISKGTKIDNLVQVAHNVEVGENTVMAAQAGIAGSSKVGSWCMLGGQVGISGHVSIGDKTSIGAQSGVTGNIKAGETVIGSPPTNPREFFKSVALSRRLPEMKESLTKLQKEVEELKKTINSLQK